MRKLLPSAYICTHSATTNWTHHFPLSLLWTWNHPLSLSVCLCVLPRDRNLLICYALWDKKCLTYSWYYALAGVGEQLTSWLAAYWCVHTCCTALVLCHLLPQAPLAVPVAGAGGEGTAGAHGDLCSAEVMHAPHTLSIQLIHALNVCLTLSTCL